MKSVFTLLLSALSFSAFTQTFTVYTDPAGDNSLQAIAIDEENWTELEDIVNTRTLAYDAVNQVLWVGTLARGLFKVENGTITNYIWSNSAIPIGYGA